MKRYEKYKDSGVQWIGEIPEHWEVTNVGKAFTFGKGLPITKADLTDDGIAVISYGQVHSKLNTGTSMDESLVRHVSERWLETHRQNLLNKGDFAFADTSEDIEGSGNCAYNDYQGTIFAGYHIVIARPKDKNNSDYWAFQFQCKNWRSQVQSLVNGVKVYSISKTILKKASLLIPPVTEQYAIVHYLKDKTLKIDQYVAARERERELLESLKQSEIANVVTKGLNPNAPMKDSGIPWIGMIPEHWEVCRNKDIFTESKDVVGDKAGSYTLLSLTKQGVIIRDLSEGKGKFPKEFNTYKIVEPGDIIFCLFDVDETPRTVGLSTHHGMITGAYDVFKVKRILPQYILYYYLAIDDRKAMRPLYKGLRKVVPMPSFMSCKIPVPPLSEQQAIVTYIDEKLSKIDRCLADLQTEIDYLKEFKQRLISDAVTGQICITNEIK